MCAYVVTQSPMAELNPVSDTHVILESMLQKLRLNTQQTNSRSLADMTGESNAEAVEDTSKATVYQFGSSSNSYEQDGQAPVWNKWENPPHLTPDTKQHFKRISKHSRLSKPKRPPLIWREHKHGTSERTNDVTSWVSDDQMATPKQSNEPIPRYVVSPSNETESFRNPPDLLAPTLITSSSVLEKTEVRGQSDTLRWATGTEKNEGTRFHESQSPNSAKTRKWGEAKRWAQNVKEKWRERHRSIPNKQRGDGQRQAQNEVQSNHSLSSEPVDVNNAPMALTETTEIHHEPIGTAPDEDGSGSLDYMSESLFSFGTNNLIEEIFSGTQWAQFLSGNCTMMDQSNEQPSCINQSHEEEWNNKWTHKNSVDSHVEMTQPSMLESSAQDITSYKPVYNQPETFSAPSSRANDLTTNSLNASNTFTIQSQNTNLNLNKPYNSEQSNEQSQHDPNESHATENSDQPMPVQESTHMHEAAENFIPLLDLSYAKPKDRSSITSFGSLSRKRVHWRRDPLEQDMEDEDYGSSFRAKRSSISFHSVSPTSSLNSLPDSVAEDPASPASAVKKRKMEETRRVRFAEEVVILPTSYLSEFNEEDDDGEDEDEDKEDDSNNSPEEPSSLPSPDEPSPRPSFPKWVISLKGRSAKYKF